MLDRTVAPPYESVGAIHIPEFKARELPNGVPLYYLNQGNQDAIKFELILSSGVAYETKPGTSYFVSKLLTSGTNQLSASEISERLDYYGAFIETSAGFDHIAISGYCIKKFLRPILDLFKQLLTDSVFPEKEVDILVRQKINELVISEKKDSQVAAKRFRQNLFGLQHPYGSILSKEDVGQVTRNDLISYYEKIFFNQPIAIVSGKVDEDVLDQVSNTLTHILPTRTTFNQGKVLPLDQKEVLRRSESVQSAIRIGKHVPNRKHEDIHKLHITTSILGGYFGSRLMKNIREDKGFTYGISASIAHLQHGSFLVISTDVVKAHTNETLVEIRKELDLLRTKAVEKEELTTIKNYLAGQFLGGLDSPFSIAAKFKSVLLNGLDYGYYNEFLQTLASISHQEVQEIATKYYDFDSMFSVIVGEEI